MSQNTVQIIYWVLNTLILIVNCYFISTSTANAIRIGRKLNNEKEKDTAKRNLFLSLFALRGSQLHYDFVKGLNQIEVVFEDVPQVISAWRQHFASLNNKGQINAHQNWEIERAALLSAMAVHLGYSNIPHGELLRDYYPEGHDSQVRENMEFRAAQKKYFEQQGDMAAIILQRMADQDNGVRGQDGSLLIK